MKVGELVTKLSQFDSDLEVKIRHAPAMNELEQGEIKVAKEEFVTITQMFTRIDRSKRDDRGARTKT